MSFKFSFSELLHTMENEVIHIQYHRKFWSDTENAIMTLSFWTEGSGQIVQAQIRLLLVEQSDKGLHCLLFALHHFDKITQGLTSLFWILGSLQQISAHFQCYTFNLLLGWTRKSSCQRYWCCFVPTNKPAIKVLWRFTYEHCNTTETKYFKTFWTSYLSGNLKRKLQTQCSLLYYSKEL